MALNIKNPRVHELAREAARRTGTSQTSVIEQALERLLADLDDAPGPRHDRAEQVHGLLVEFRAGLSDDERAGIRADFEGLYDDQGLPA